MNKTHAHAKHVMAQGKLAASKQGRQELRKKGIVNGSAVDFAKAILMADGGQVPFDQAEIDRMKQIMSKPAKPVEMPESSERDDIEPDEEDEADASTNSGARYTAVDQRSIDETNKWLETHPYAENPIVKLPDGQSYVDDEIELRNHKRSGVFSAIDQADALEKEIETLERSGDKGSAALYDAKQKLSNLQEILLDKNPEANIDPTLLDAARGDINLYAKIKSDPGLYAKFDELLDSYQDDDDENWLEDLADYISSPDSQFYASASRPSQAGRKLRQYVDDRGVTVLTNKPEPTRRFSDGLADEEVNELMFGRRQGAQQKAMGGRVSSDNMTSRFARALMKK